MGVRSAGSAAVTDPALARTLARCDTVLFDFDGPLCDVFAGLPAPQVARQLEALARRTFETDDPLEVLRQAFTGTHAAFNAVEDQLIAAEVAAVELGTPEKDGMRALRISADLGWRTAIVSNNSPDAIRHFLAHSSAASLVITIAGRPYRRPDLMKPDPTLIRQAVDELSGEPERSVLIGDSITDIEAADRAGVHCIAYANKPSKVGPFMATGVPVVTRMSEVAHALDEDGSRRHA